jgi:hypothetical protein
MEVTSLSNLHHYLKSISESQNDVEQKFLCFNPTSFQISLYSLFILFKEVLEWAVKTIPHSSLPKGFLQ